MAWGLLSYSELPLVLSVLLSVVVMVFIIYLQHVLVHVVPALWRFHQVHHADLDYDLTKGFAEVHIVNGGMTERN